MVGLLRLDWETEASSREAGDVSDAVATSAVVETLCRAVLLALARHHVAEDHVAELLDPLALQVLVFSYMILGYTVPR